MRDGMSRKRKPNARAEKRHQALVERVRRFRWRTVRWFVAHSARCFSPIFPQNGGDREL